MTQKAKGDAPKGELDLQGLRVQKKSDTRFDLQTPASTHEGRVYMLDVGAKNSNNDAVHDLPTWVKALEQEAIFARRERPVAPVAKARTASRMCFFPTRRDTM